MAETAAPTIAEENEALIQEMMRDAQPTEVPGGLTQNPVIHRGNEALPSPMVLRTISSAGYVKVWDTLTFEEIPVIYYMLPSKLRQRRGDGGFRFTTVKPAGKPQGGTIKCLLHESSPNRAHYDKLGFPSCKKANIPNAFQSQEHMRKRHKQEWAAIENEKKEVERQEDRELQQLLLKKAAQNPIIVEKKERKSRKTK